MQIQITPKILLDILLKETVSAIASIINAHYSTLPESVKRDISTRIPNTFKNIVNGSTQIDTGCDPSVLLNLFWSDWNVFAEKLLSPDEIEYSKLTYRSYISILIHARNESAHTNPLTYLDVLYYSLTAARLLSNEETEQTTAIDGIIEECFERTHRRVENQETPGPSLPVESKADAPISASLINSSPADSSTFLSDDQLKEALQKIDDICTQEKYDELAEIINYPKEVTAPTPKFKDTFCLSDGKIIFAFGVKNFQLIKQNLIHVAVFAITGGTIEETRGTYKGYDVICLPSSEQNEVFFGRVKAQIICSKMKEISEWLKKHKSGC